MEVDHRISKTHHNKYFYFVILTWCLVLLFGCSTEKMFTKKVPVEQVQNINRIGVISLMGTKLEARYIGDTIFQNKHEDFVVNEWGIDDAIRIYIKNELDSGSNFSYIDFEYDSNRLQHQYQENKSISFSKFMSGFDIKPIEDDLKRISQEQKLDAIILVLPTVNPEQQLIALSKASGIGFYQSDSAFFEKTTSVYAIYQIVVIDTQTYKKLAHKPWSSSPYKDIPNIAWKDTYEEYSDEEIKLIEKSIKDLIRKQISIDFKKIGLTN